MEVGTAAPPAERSANLEGANGTSSGPVETPPGSPVPHAPGAEEPHGELEGDSPGEQAPVEPELVIEGQGQLSLAVGGAKPDGASVKLTGGSISVPGGQFSKGDTLNLLVKVQVAEVHFVDKRDGSTGEVVATERRHILKTIGVEKV